MQYLLGRDRIQTTIRKTWSKDEAKNVIVKFSYDTTEKNLPISSYFKMQKGIKKELSCFPPCPHLVWVHDSTCCGITKSIFLNALSMQWFVHLLWAHSPLLCRQTSSQVNRL